MTSLRRSKLRFDTKVSHRHLINSSVLDVKLKKTNKTRRHSLQFQEEKSIQNKPTEKKLRRNTETKQQPLRRHTLLEEKKFGGALQLWQFCNQEIALQARRYWIEMQTDGQKDMSNHQSDKSISNRGHTHWHNQTSSTLKHIYLSSIIKTIFSYGNNFRNKRFESFSVHQNQSSSSNQMEINLFVAHQD